MVGQSVGRLANQLAYTTIFSQLTGYIPHRNFTTLRAEDGSSTFKFLAERLEDIDVDFFLHCAEVEKRGFIFGNCC